MENGKPYVIPFITVPCSGNYNSTHISHMCTCSFPAMVPTYTAEAFQRTGRTGNVLSAEDGTPRKIKGTKLKSRDLTEIF